MYCSYFCSKCNESFLKNHDLTQEIPTVEKCEKCGTESFRETDSGIAPVGVVKGHTVGKEIRAEAEYVKTLQIMKEPLTKDEIQSLPEIAKEEARRRGTTVDAILGKKTPDPNKPVVSKEQFKKRAAEQRRQVEKALGSGFENRIKEAKKNQRAGRHIKK